MVDLATTVQWWWECDAYGQPLGGESGAGIDLYDCKARFKKHGRGYASGEQTKKS
jgi:hypothetical protein